MEVSFAGRQQHYLQATLLPLGHHGPVDLYLPLHRAAVARRIEHLEWATAAQLDAVVEDSVSGQAVGSKAGARVVHFE